MKKFHVLVNGQNFLVNIDGKTKKHGFFQNFLIETISVEDAAEEIIEKVRDDKELKKITLNSRKDSPNIEIEEINELNTFEGLEGVDSGRTWYVEAKWWQFWK